MALVEAMSMSVPVLGSDISGINFVLKDFPELLFPAGESKELAEKINSFYQKPIKEKQKIGNNLRNYTIQNFSINRFITAHEKLYLSLIKK